MTLIGKQKNLKIIIGEKDMVYDHPLYEAIVLAASKLKMSGITVYHGISGFGAAAYQTPPHISKSERPVILEAIDAELRIAEFADIVKRLFDKSGCNGVMYSSDVEVIHYRSRE